LRVAGQWVPDPEESTSLICPFLYGNPGRIR